MQVGAENRNKTIAANNDGSQPWQPYHRLPQSTFERYGRQRLSSHPLIDFRPGWSFRIGVRRRRTSRT